jgi:twitching motility two-component system response regulator PilH
LARKILLADDSVTAQNMGRRILSDAGYDVITVNNGSSALKKIAESKPDLIVLDVYMPGYGGLEVCQRIRESQETARIPVLLTVGKLEPFKPEEARRVRADAYIVKPFEASELLTALTKLEDKIVPPPLAHKQGRFPKPGPSDDFGATADFGDREGGWKSRLKIPPPHHPKAAESMASAEEEVVAGTPAPEANLSSDNEADAATLTAGGAESAPAAELETPVPVEPVSAGDPDITQEFAVEVEAAPADAEPSQIPSHTVPEAVDEVAAALASLSPAHGNGSEPITGDTAEVPVTMAVAAAGQEFSGPRWIAEEVGLSNDESALILEQEMQKAFAAFAAADAAPLGRSASFTEFPAPDAASGPSAASDYAEPPTVDEPVSLGAARDREEPPAVPPASPDATAEIAVHSETVDSEVKEDAAYAVAASAAVGSASPDSHAQASTTSQPSEPPKKPDDSAREAELAAAWASWKQVRDSVATPESTSQMADAATGFKDLREEPTPTPEVEASPSSSDTGAVSSIVDSVLAELRPKLMEEIAKKMGKEKK